MLLQYHLAGNLVLINCQNMTSCVEIVHIIRYAYIAQSTSDIIAIYIV